MSTFDIHMNALSKADQKHVRKVHGMGEVNVGSMRSILVVGKVGTVLLTVMAFLALVGLGLLLVPFLFIAPLALVVTPFKVAADNRKWESLLPAERDADLVRLV